MSRFWISVKRRKIKKIKNRIFEYFIQQLKTLKRSPISRWLSFKIIWIEPFNNFEQIILILFDSNIVTKKSRFCENGVKEKYYFFVILMTQLHFIFVNFTVHRLDLPPAFFYKSLDFMYLSHNYDLENKKYWKKT